MNDNNKYAIIASIETLEQACFIHDIKLEEVLNKLNEDNLSDK